MKKMYPIITALKHSPALIKCCITVVTCCLLLQARAQVYVYTCKGTQVTFTAPPAPAGADNTVYWWDKEDVRVGLNIAVGQTYTITIPDNATSVTFFYSYGPSLTVARYKATAVLDYPNKAFGGPGINDFALAKYGCLNSNISVQPSWPVDGGLLDCSGSRGAFTTAQVPVTSQSISMQAMVYWKGGNGQDQYIINSGKTGANGSGIYVRGSDNKVIIRNAGIAIPTDVVLEQNKWVNVAAVYDAVTGYWWMYYDGKVYTPTANANLATIPPGAGFYIGNDNKTKYFNGFIDYVGIYNKALSAYEVGDNRYIGVSTGGYYSYPVSGLVGGWIFDETDGGTVCHDITGNNIDVTLTTADAHGYFDAGYVWNMNGTTVTGFFPKYSFSTEGEKSITLTAKTMTGCPEGDTASAPKTILINSLTVLTATLIIIIKPQLHDHHPHHFH